MNVFLVDGTYELFRHYYAVPSATDVDGHEIGAVRGVLNSMLSLLEDKVTHLGVATDHVVESFRNALWPGYKTGDGIDPALAAQFGPLESALEELGITVWPMTDLEADDGLASAAAVASEDGRVEQIFICTPDKDLAQCVVDQRVVQFDRRSGTIRDAEGVVEKFGVSPAASPDYLALVGDAADGFPGLRGWGAKAASAVLGRYQHLEKIPNDAGDWRVTVRGAARLADELVTHQAEAFLFRDLATLRCSARLFQSVDELRWTGFSPAFFDLCVRFQAPGLLRRAQAVAAASVTKA